ncbi:MAG: hypothetical protein P9M12_01100 [Candidatus Aceula lacicola]|nr:hypothetical protein [Candidatus Aceula lacicola]
MMKELEINKKLNLWQVIVLVQLVLIIFLGLLIYGQQSSLVSQKTYINALKEGISIREQNAQILSKRLISAMTLLQSATREITQDGVLTQEEILIQK